MNFKLIQIFLLIFLIIATKSTYSKNPETKQMDYSTLAKELNKISNKNYYPVLVKKIIDIEDARHIRVEAIKSNRSFIIPIKISCLNVFPTTIGLDSKLLAKSYNLSEEQIINKGTYALTLTENAFSKQIPSFFIVKTNSAGKSDGYFLGLPIYLFEDGSMISWVDYMKAENPKIYRDVTNSEEQKLCNIGRLLIQKFSNY